MTDVFRLDMLPAREGDCLVLTYGDDASPHRVMVDTGRKATYRSIKKSLSLIPSAQRRFELLIVSHIDRDHIEGVIEMLSDPELAISFRDVWFNGYQHLQNGDIEAFGGPQGEALTELLRRPGSTWNKRFKRRSVELARARTPIGLPGGLTLRLLSPHRDELLALIPEWDRDCKKAGLVKDVAGWREPLPSGIEGFGGGSPDVEALAAVPFTPDTSKSNATSIAVVAEYKNRRVLLAADGGAERLAASLGPLAQSEGGRFALGAFKLPHHGSMYNLSPQLLKLVDCRRFLISSNGSYFDHPQPETIARILKTGPGVELVFNYRSPETLAWNDDGLKATWGYTTTYPPPAQDGTISVNLLAS